MNWEMFWVALGLSLPKNWKTCIYGVFLAFPILSSTITLVRRISWGIMIVIIQTSSSVYTHSDLLHSIHTSL